ncbi:hypothetical protein RSAG8_03518, partial [Rhizoctonia solani AG-8 WAC10335]
MPQSEGDPVVVACVSIPARYVKEVESRFYCPPCLSKRPDIPLDYIINRGASATQRQVVSSEVVIVAASLEGMEARLQNVVDGIESMLGAFEMKTHSYFISTWTILCEADINAIMRLPPYHLVFIFMTESDISGGWWTKPRESSSEADWLTLLLVKYKSIAQGALTARIFGLCCGLNLHHKTSIPGIQTALKNSNWQSIVLPTASTVLYYNGTSLQSAVVRVWGTSKRARYHTDVLLIQNNAGNLRVEKFRYGSQGSRPFGVDLPNPTIYCACSRSSDRPSNWKRKDGKIGENLGEYVVRYKTSCGCAHLDVAVYNGGFKIRNVAEVQLITQEYDFELCRFPLDSSDAITMKLRLIKGAPDERGMAHDFPWTVFGKEAISSHGEKQIT